MNDVPPVPVTRTGLLRFGTSGFAYPGWAPTFYPTGLPNDDLLRYYAARLVACELNSTFYQRPKPAAIRGWVARTPSEFRFSIKAQRGASLRALLGDDPAASLAWLTEPLPTLGERLGSVLFRVPGEIVRDDRRLSAMLDAWPGGLPLTMEFQHGSWHVDEVFEQLRSHGVVLCATELDAIDERESDPPSLRVTGPFLYLRLRKASYAPLELEAWAARIVPFLDDGLDVYCFFRHDATGLAPGRATALRDLVAARRLAERTAGPPS